MNHKSLEVKGAMNRLVRHSIAVLVLAGLSGARPCAAQTFDSGSTGAYGPINVVSGTTTLPMPADGIFHATTITVANGATLKFTKNALNTPVYLLATGAITITGTIDVAGGTGTSSPPQGGIGGPGGFDGGTPGLNSVAPGPGHGPGGGAPGDASSADAGAGAGVYGSPANAVSAGDGQVYGSPLLLPLVGGSGGGGTTGSPGAGGGGGGGAIVLASNTRVDIAGTITANGGGVSTSSYGTGSGGAIRLIAPVVAGAGALRVRGGCSSCSQEGGDGRIRIDTFNRAGVAFSFDPVQVTTIGGLMLVFPSPLPRLDIISAAGTSIAEGAASPVNIILPTGSPTTQSITVQAKDFNAGSAVDINIVLVPESGTTVVVPATINMTTNPATVTVDAGFTVNTVTHVYAWTR